MGLYVTATGLTQETCFDCGYLSYDNFLCKLATVAYGEEMGELYRKFTHTDYFGTPTQEEIEFWNSNCNDDLDMFLFHSDCDGKFTPKECRKIYKALKPLKMDLIGHNYIVMQPYNMLEHWKDIFKHCADRRVNLYYR